MSRPSIPAELKRCVLCEAGHRCAIHTCRSIIEVDIHHIVPWSKCKEHSYENLIALCPNCHRLADRGRIDQKSLRIYKANLRYVHDKFSQFEVDVLFTLHDQPEKSALPFPPFMVLLIKRILDAGYIGVEHPKGSSHSFGMQISPCFIFLTDDGYEYIDSLKVDQGH